MLSEEAPPDEVGIAAFDEVVRLSDQFIDGKRGLYPALSPAPEASAGALHASVRLLVGSVGHHHFLGPTDQLCSCMGVAAGISSGHDNTNPEPFVTAPSLQPLKIAFNGAGCFLACCTRHVRKRVRAVAFGDPAFFRALKRDRQLAT